MGTDGIWKLLEPYRKTVPLIELATQEGVIENKGNIRAWRVGVDIGGLFYACNHHRSQAENIPIASMFKKVLCLFSEAPIIPVFVFDGPGRPGIKRGKTVRGNAHWMERPLKALLDSLGLPYHQAPAEAEAELAHMSKYLFIDCVLTADSDIFAFGARRVFRLTPQTFHDNVLVGDLYEAYPWTGDDFSFISLLAGGDYDPGIQGCGVKIAAQIIPTRVHDRLFQASRDLPLNAFATFLRLWRLEFQTVCKQHRSARVRALYLPVDFPRPNVIGLYLSPLISDGTTPAPILSWETAPDLQSLSHFIHQHFAWSGSLDKVIARFYRDILPGLVVRALLKILLIDDDNLDEDISPYSPVIIGTVTPHANQQKRIKHQLLLKVAVPPQLLTLITSHIPSSLGHSFDNETAKVWIPRALYHKVVAVQGRADKGEGQPGLDAKEAALEREEKPDHEFDESEDIGSEVEVMESGNFIYMITVNEAGGETWEIFSDSDSD